MKKFYKEAVDKMIDDLVKWRKEENIRLEEVAVCCGVTKETVRNFENKKNFNYILLIWYLYESGRLDELKKLFI